MSVRLSLLLAVGLLTGGMVVSAQTPERLPSNIGVQGRFSHLLDGQGLYDSLIESYDYGIYGATLGWTARPENGEWYEYAWNYPSYGFGLSYACMGALDFKNASRLGDVLNLYGWAEFDLLRTPVFRLGPILELGMAYTGQTYDYYRNPSNLYVGSKLFALIGTGLRAEWLFAPQWSLLAGVYLTHHSNGMLRSPNLGLNEFSCGLGVRHYFAPTRFTSRPTVAPDKPDYGRRLQ
jgi:hypothetical protein